MALPRLTLATSAALLASILLTACASSGGKTDNTPQNGPGRAVLGGSTPDKPTGWKPVPSDEGRSATTPAGPVASQPRATPVTEPSAAQPATTTSSQPTPAPANNTVTNPGAMVRPPVDRRDFGTTTGGTGVSAARIRELAEQAQTSGEYASASSLWREYTSLRADDGEAWLHLAESLAATATDTSKDAVAKSAAEAARKAWASGVTKLDRYSAAAFTKVAAEAAWVGLLAELKVRAERLAAAPK